MALEIEELVKIVIIIVLLAVLIGAFIFLFKGKGSQVLEAFKNILRFGK